MKSNTRLKLYWGLAAVLVIVPALILGNYFVKENYKQHHYLTIKMGGSHPQTEHVTEQQWEAISRQAESETQQGIDAANQQRRLQKLNGQ